MNINQSNQPTTTSYPTGDDYCANCGRTPCAHTWAIGNPETVAAHPNWTCQTFTWPQPLTEFHAVMQAIAQMHTTSFPAMSNDEFSEMLDEALNPQRRLEALKEKMAREHRADLAAELKADALTAEGITNNRCTDCGMDLGTHRPTCTSDQLTAQIRADL